MEFAVARMVELFLPTCKTGIGPVLARLSCFEWMESGRVGYALDFRGLGAVAMQLRRERDRRSASQTGVAWSELGVLVAGAFFLMGRLSP